MDSHDEPREEHQDVEPFIEISEGLAVVAVACDLHWPLASTSGDIRTKRCRRRPSWSDTGKATGKTLIHTDGAPDPHQLAASHAIKF